jgi:hypothetical protein
MSKQDIEKRLGFAAQGVKAEMAIGSYKQGDRTVTVNGKKYEVLPYQMDFFIKELATLDTPEWRADVVKEYLRRGYIKSTSARPGVKAKFADAALNQIRNNAAISDKIRTLVSKGLSVPQAIDSVLGEGTYKRIGSEVYDELRKDKSSRPGAKAKMAADWKIGDAVHLGMGTVGGVGYNGIITKLDGDTVYIESTETDNKYGPRTFKGLVRYLSRNSRPGSKAKFGRFSTEFGFLANQIKNQPDLAKKNIIALAKKMGKEVDITRAEFEQLMQYAAKLGMETQVANAHDDVRPGFSRTGAKGKFVRIVTTPQGRYTTNLDKNTRAPIEGGKGYVMVDPAQYITPKRVRVQGTKGEIEVRAVLDGKEIVGVSAKLVSSRPGMKAKMAFPSASTASSRTEELLRKELSRIAGEGYIQYKGRSKINTLKSKSDFLQMIGDLRSHLAPLQKKWVSKSEQEQDAAGSLEASSALNTISGALKKLDQLTTMANGVTTAARPSAKAKA